MPTSSVRPDASKSSSAAAAWNAFTADFLWAAFALFSVGLVVLQAGAYHDVSVMPPPRTVTIRSHPDR